MLHAPPTGAIAGKPRILVIFGTRPEAIKLFPLVHVLRGDPRIECLTCATGQHRDMVDSILSLADMVPDESLDVLRPGQSLDELVAALVSGIGKAIDTHLPDRVVVQGDTATAFAGALAAYNRRIPVDHVEAGLRSGDLLSPWPEEGNRKAIAAFASLHFAPTASAAAALRAENVPEGRIAMTGNTVIDALRWVHARLDDQPQLAAGLDTAERTFSGRRIIAATCHRRENLDGGIERIAHALQALASRDDVALVVPLHRNPQASHPLRLRLSGLDNVQLVEPLDYPHFVRLLSLAHFVLTDSGGVQEEAPALGKPVLVLRDTTERPEGVAAGTARLVGTDTRAIVEAAEELLDDPQAHARMALAHNPYGDGRAAERIAARIALELRLRHPDEIRPRTAAG
jgi:UDP-N-acetylglucosamine 2-epimerase (non-hydrolysing)